MRGRSKFIIREAFGCDSFSLFTSYVGFEQNKPGIVYWGIPAWSASRLPFASTLVHTLKDTWSCFSEVGLWELAILRSTVARSWMTAYPDTISLVPWKPSDNSSYRARGLQQERWAIPFGEVGADDYQN